MVLSERTVSSALPDGAAEHLLTKADFLPFFGPGATTVTELVGLGVAFDDNGRVISYVRGESELGKRVGWGRFNGRTHGFLLTPVEQKNK